MDVSRLVEHVFSTVGEDWKATCTLLEKALAYTRAKITQDEKTMEVVSTTTTTHGPLLCTLPLQSCLSPRGKFTLAFHESCLILNGNTKENTIFSIPYSNVHCLMKLPKMDPVKKNTIATYLFILYMKTPFTVRKSQTRFVAFRVSALAKETLDITMNLKMNLKMNMKKENDDDDNSISISGQVAHVMSEIFKKSIPHQSIITSAPDRKALETFSSTNGLPYVKCYWKTNDGLLYLLPEGLLFLTPFQFIARGDIEAIQCGRGGSASSRTFDLQVEGPDDQMVEFTMIEREELPAITEFVKHFAKLKANDEAKKKLKMEKVKGEEEVAVEKNEDVEEEEEDDDDSEDDEAYVGRTVDVSESSSSDEESLSGDADSGSEGSVQLDDQSEDENDEEIDVQSGDENVNSKVPVDSNENDTESDEDTSKPSTPASTKKRTIVTTIDDSFFVAKKLKTK